MEFLSFMPQQKLPESSKDHKWYKTCIDGAIGLIYSYDTSRRATRFGKKINYDLYAGIFHKDDLKYVTNPLGMDRSDVPAELKHYDIVTPIFNLLIGEESRRLFNFMVRATNDDAISQKQETLKKLIYDQLAGRLSSNLSDEEKQDPKFLAGLQKYARYDFKDSKEIAATRSLQYLVKKQRVQEKLLTGFEDALVAGEEIYRIDINNGEPTMRRCNPLEVFYLLPHNSFELDEADVIVEETWMSVGQIIDMWYDELTPAQIDLLERGVSSVGGVGDNLNYEMPRTIYTSDIPEVDSVYDLSNRYDYLYNYYDRGRDKMRVLRSVWKSRKKIGVLRYLDPETEELVEEIVPEFYKALDGQEVEWLWVNEYREGTKIGADIYVDMHPCKVQRRNMDNLSSCKSPYVGTVYNANNSKSVSLMDRVKPYQYLYNIIFYRTELALAKSIGKVMEFDLASIPREYGFDIDKWLYYIQAMGISFKNSFEESEKGKALGMMNTASANKSIDMEQGAYIDKHIQLLSFIEGKIGELSGVTKQRQGQIENRELVGNTERSVMQSSLITEKWFDIHNGVKRRVLEALLEVAKEAWRGKSKKMQFVMDDMSSIIAELDGSEFEDTEYGIFVTNSAKDNEALQYLKQITQMGLQSDKLNMSQVIDIMMTESIADTRRKIEDFEAQREQAQQEQNKLQQQEIESAKQQAAQTVQAQLEMKQQELDLQKYKIDSDNETKIQVAEIQVFSRQQDLDTNGNGIPDPLEVGRLALEERELDSNQYAIDKENEHKDKDREHAKHESQEKINIERKKLELQEKELYDKEKERKSKEKIEKIKAETALKVAKENKSKAEMAKKKSSK